MKIIKKRDQEQAIRQLINVGRYMNERNNKKDNDIDFVWDDLASLAYAIGGIHGCAKVGLEIFGSESYREKATELEKLEE